eukprot:TRINITY_DN3408_c0_g1_i1.p1 TRINITY_DN3408_c0_g1~~TRINITY_DN3408_c0_g1_i1.p1  ORF type:complete len:629 (+),score=50.58 TRINITY_DN3408_c0_g1_i1:41-1927(+)
MDTNRAVPTVAHPVLPGLPSLLNPPMMNLNQNSPINILRPGLQPLSVLSTQFIPPTVLPGMTNPLTPSSNVFPQIQPRPAPTNSTATNGIRMIPSAPTTIPAEGPVPELTFMELQEVMTKLKKDLRTKKGFASACTQITRLIPKYLNGESKRLFYDSLNIASFRLGKPGFSVAAAKPMFLVAYEHRHHLTPGYRKNVEEWKATVEKMDDNAPPTVPQTTATAGRFGNAPARRSSSHHSSRGGLTDILQTLMSSMRDDDSDSDDSHNGHLCSCGRHHGNGHGSSDSEDVNNMALVNAFSGRSPLELLFGNQLMGIQNTGEKKTDSIPYTEYPYSEYESVVYGSFKVFTRQENQMQLAFSLSNDVLTKVRTNPGAYQLRLCCFDDLKPYQSLRAPAVLHFALNTIDVNMNFLNGVDEILGIDITSKCRAVNNLTITRFSNWGLFSNISFSIRLAKVNTIDTLKERMQPYNVCFEKVSKSFHGDNDIAEVSLKFSLRCPLSLMRIELPIKGKDCKHIQCFDANSYLQINKNHPKFDCPVCNKKVYFSTLIVDSYFLKILGEVQSQPDVDEVLILPDGTYNIVPPKEEKSSDEDSYSESVSRKRKIDQVVGNTAPVEPNKRQKTAPDVIELD